MKVTILKNEKNSTPEFPITSLLLLILGIILVLNSNGLINTIFTILGVIITIYGISQFFRFYKLKNQLHIENSTILVQGVTSSLAGLIIIFLANFITNAIQVITGIWLLVTGMSKMSQAVMWKANKNILFSKILSATILIILGIYTIFAQNIVFVIIGIIIILYASIDIINFYRKK